MTQDALRAALGAMPRLRLTGEQIDSIQPTPDGAGDFAVDWDEYDEFLPWSMIEAVLAAQPSGGGEGLRLRLTGEMLSEIDAMWPHAGAGPFAATVDWDEYEEFAATPPDLHPADASGGGEAEPTCRDCGLTREQIDWGWHSAPYEGQFAAALTRPVSEVPEAPAGTVALCGTAVAPHWHVFGPDCDSVATYDTEAEARAALASQGLAITEAPDAEGAEPDALPDDACGAMGLCERRKGHEGKHTTSVDRALEGVVLRAAPPSSVDGEGLRTALERLDDVARDLLDDLVGWSAGYGREARIRAVQEALGASAAALALRR